MFSRLADLPVYHSMPESIEAPRYNRVRLALLRGGKPLRIPLPGLRDMVMVVDDDGWVCVDPSMNDLPVLAWVDFSAAGRDNLHLPVPCRMLQFHCHADLIAETSLKIMDKQLQQWMRGDGDQP